MLKNTSFVLSRSCRILKQKKNQTGSYDLSTFHITKTLLGFSPSPFRPSMPNILCYKNTTNSCEILFSFMLGWKWTQFPSYSWKLLNNSILFLLKDQSTPLLEEKKNKVELDKTKSFILIPAYIEVLTRSWSLITWLYENHVTGKWCFFMWSKSIMV